MSNPVSMGLKPQIQAHYAAQNSDSANAYPLPSHLPPAEGGNKKHIEQRTINLKELYHQALDRQIAEKKKRETADRQRQLQQEREIIYAAQTKEKEM